MNSGWVGIGGLLRLNDFMCLNIYSVLLFVLWLKTKQKESDEKNSYLFSYMILSRFFFVLLLIMNVFSLLTCIQTWRGQGCIFDTLRSQSRHLKSIMNVGGKKTRENITQKRFWSISTKKNVLVSLWWWGRELNKQGNCVIKIYSRM